MKNTRCRVAPFFCIPLHSHASSELLNIHLWKSTLHGSLQLFRVGLSSVCSEWKWSTCWWWENSYAVENGGTTQNTASITNKTTFIVISNNILNNPVWDRDSIIQLLGLLPVSVVVKKCGTCGINISFIIKKYIAVQWCVFILEDVWWMEINTNKSKKWEHWFLNLVWTHVPGPLPTLTHSDDT